jgi:signal transduction histidine kinase
MSEMTKRDIFQAAAGAARREPQMRLLAISAVAPVVVHELAQPLAAALNHLAVASRRLEGGNSAAVREAVRLAEATVTRAANIVRRMRAFMIEGAVDARPVNLGEAVRRVRTQICGERNCDLDLRVAVDRDADFVCADRLLIDLVLSNLLVNAAEAAPPGTPARVAIAAARLGDLVRITVSDTGRGLTAETRRRLFEPLFTTKPGGSGVGLALCKVIVEAHGGQLWAAEPGPGGATFHMTLPAPTGAGS